MFNLNSLNSRRSCAYIAADIDASQVKLVEISRKKGRFCIENYAIYPRSSEWSEWNKQLSSNLFFNAREIVTAVSDSQILSKTIIVGKKLSDKEKEEYLSLEMEKMALCSMSELAMDFQAVNRMNDSENLSERNLEIFCVAVRRQTIESLQQLFHGTVFKIKKIGLASQMPVQEIINLSNIAINPRISREQWEKDRLLLSKACEMALYFPYQDHALNFLPWRKIRREKQQKLAIAACVFGLIIALMTYFVFDNFFEQAPANNHSVLNPKAVIKKNPMKIHKKLQKKTQLALKKPEYSLKNTAVSAFKMLGFIKKGKKETKNSVWGIIQTPDGTIFHVTIGDTIGKESATIIHISEKQILLNHHHVNGSNRTYIIN